jgi:hypothetical protein
VGQLTNKPPCPNPKCDYKPDFEELKRIERQIEQEIEKLEEGKE